jgi:hypothetical protein
LKKGGDLQKGLGVFDGSETSVFLLFIERWLEEFNKHQKPQQGHKKEEKRIHYKQHSSSSSFIVCYIDGYMFCNPFSKCATTPPPPPPPSKFQYRSGSFQGDEFEVQFFFSHAQNGNDDEMMYLFLQPFFPYTFLAKRRKKYFF